MGTASYDYTTSSSQRLRTVTDMVGQTFVSAWRGAVVGQTFSFDPEALDALSGNNRQAGMPAPPLTCRQFRLAACGGQPFDRA